MSRPKGVLVDTELIRAERERQGLTTAELAELTKDIARAADLARGEAPTDPGLTARTIINAEKGKPASKRTARLIAQALRLPYLFVVRHDLDEIANHLAREGLNAEAPPREWAGRQQEEDYLARCLLSASRRACISGAASTGKTALAQKIVHREDIRAHYINGVVWLGNSPALREQRHWVVMMQIAKPLGFAHLLPSPADHSPETIRKRFLYCLNKGAVLIVLDDLTDERPLRWLIPEAGQVGTLVITRNRTLAKSFGQDHQTLADLSTDDAAALMEQFVDKSRIDRAAVEALIQQTSGIPNSIRLAAISLRNDEALTLTQYIEHYKRDLDQVRYKRARTAQEASSDDRLERQIASLESHSRYVDKEAFGLLRTLSTFETAPFSEHWVKALVAAEAELVKTRLQQLIGVLHGAADSTASSLRIEDVVSVFGKQSWGEHGRHDPVVLARAGLTEARRISALPPLERWRSFDTYRRLWALCFSRLVDEVLQGDEQAIDAQAEALKLDQEATAVGGAPILIELVLALRSLLIQGTFPEARRWLHAAYATARSQQDLVAEGRLAETIGVHCYPDCPRAFEWFKAGIRAHEACGERTHLASVMTELSKMHHGMNQWEEGLAALQRSYDLSVEVNAPPALLAVRANNVALGHLVLPEPHEDSFEVSTRMMREAMRQTSYADGMLRILHEVARVNLLLSHLREKGSTPEDIDQGLEAFAQAMGPESVYLSYPILTAQWLNRPFEYELNTLAHCKALWSKAIYGERSAVDPLLRHISCVVFNLRRIIRNRHQGQAHDEATWTIIDATASKPALADITGSIALIYIAEPFLELFDPGFIQQILEVIEHGYGHHHPAFRECAALYWEQRHGRPLEPHAEVRLSKQLDTCIERATDLVVAVESSALAATASAT